MAQTSTLSRAVAVSDHQQPSIPHPDQDAAAAAKLAALQARTGKKPNIVILLVDDMGYGDPGAFGGGEAIGAATPNMDRLAADGLKLTSTYSQQTCTPTRSAILTGRLPVRTGLTRPILAGDTITVNPWDGETSVAAILSEAGYNTALIGKWHIGEVPGMRPFDVGFDEFYGFYSAQKEITQEFDPAPLSRPRARPRKAGRLPRHGNRHRPCGGQEGRQGGDSCLQDDRHRGYRRGRPSAARSDRQAHRRAGEGR